jgi:hypothetical protein
MDSPMPTLIWVEGCGQMASSSYREVAAVFDRMYASPRDRALPIADAFAELAEAASMEVRPGLPVQGPEPGL